MALPITIIIFKGFIYLFMRDTEREGETETQAEGEAGSMQGARRGTRSRHPGVTPWAEGGAQPLSYQGVPPPLHKILKSTNLL